MLKGLEDLATGVQVIDAYKRKSNIARMKDLFDTVAEGMLYGMERIAPGDNVQNANRDQINEDITHLLVFIKIIVMLFNLDILNLFLTIYGGFLITLVASVAVNFVWNILDKERFDLLKVESLIISEEQKQFAIKISSLPEKLFSGEHVCSLANCLETFVKARNENNRRYIFPLQEQLEENKKRLNDVLMVFAKFFKIKTEAVMPTNEFNPLRFAEIKSLFAVIRDGSSYLNTKTLRLFLDRQPTGTFKEFYNIDRASVARFALLITILRLPNWKVENVGIIINEANNKAELALLTFKNEFTPSILNENSGRITNLPEEEPISGLVPKISEHQFLPEIFSTITDAEYLEAFRTIQENFLVQINSISKTLSNKPIFAEWTPLEERWRHNFEMLTKKVDIVQQQLQHPVEVARIT